MTGDVKKIRGARTVATRRKIITAATELFVSHGYHATTLEAIAARAGVAVQTVYFHYGNKCTVLKEAVDVAAVGDDEPIGILERPWLERARAEPDPRRVLALWVGYGRGIVTRVGPIMRVVRDAAVVDPEMAEQWARNEAETAAAFSVLAEQLDGMRALRVPVAEATDVLCAVCGLVLYFTLSDRGWTAERWERFVTDTLGHALLNDGPAVSDPKADR